MYPKHYPHILSTLKCSIWVKWELKDMQYKDRPLECMITQNLYKFLQNWKEKRGQPKVDDKSDNLILKFRD